MVLFFISMCVGVWVGLAYRRLMAADHPRGYPHTAVITRPFAPGLIVLWIFSGLVQALTVLGVSVMLAWHLEGGRMSGGAWPLRLAFFGIAYAFAIRIPRESERERGLVGHALRD